MKVAVLYCHALEFLTSTSANEITDKFFQTTKIEVWRDGLICSIIARIIQNFVVPNDDFFHISGMENDLVFVKNKAVAMYFFDGIIWRRKQLL